MNRLIKLSLMMFISNIVIASQSPPMLLRGLDMSFKSKLDRAAQEHKIEVENRKAILENKANKALLQELAQPGRESLTVGVGVQSEYESIPELSKICAIALTPDNKYLLAGYWTNIAKIWSLEEKKRFRIC